jgi:site-specific recombinase XerD
MMHPNTIEHHLKRFLRTKHNEQTRAWYAKYLWPMAVALGLDTPLNVVSRLNAEDYWQQVRTYNACWERHPTRPQEKRPLAPTTLHNYLRAARSFWNEIVRQQLVSANPFDHLRSPKDTRPVEMKAITPEDLRALWQAAKASSPRDYAIVTVIATTGVRAGELVSMAVSRINLHQGVAWVEGKRGWRKIFLGEASTAAIRVYLETRPNPTGDVLWRNAYGRPLTADGVRQMIDRLARQAGLRGRHNLHAFRHRAAQAWLDSGINAELVAQALGHADVTVTLSIYGNQDEKRVRNAVRQAEMAPFATSSDLVDREHDEGVHCLASPNATATDSFYAKMASRRGR